MGLPLPAPELGPAEEVIAQQVAKQTGKVIFVEFGKKAAARGILAGAGATVLALGLALLVLLWPSKIASDVPGPNAGPLPIPPPIPQPNPKPVEECPPQDDDYCKNLWNKINDLLQGQRASPPQGGGFPQGTKGIIQRWLVHSCNPGKWSPTGQKAINHLAEYVKQRNALRTKLTEWDNSRCKKKGHKSPQGVEKYADPTKEPVLGSGKDIDGNPINCSKIANP